MKKNNFTPFPLLSTERLQLRQFYETDELAIFLLRTNVNVNKYIQRENLANNREAQQFIQRIIKEVADGELIFWAISTKTSPNLIGTICLWNFSENNATAELGYEMNPAFQGNGFMDEAVKSVLEYGFLSLDFKKIEAYTHKNNEPSKGLLKKNLFILNVGRKDEDNLNNIIYSLDQSSFTP